MQKPVTTDSLQWRNTYAQTGSDFRPTHWTVCDAPWRIRQHHSMQTHLFEHTKWNISYRDGSATKTNVPCTHVLCDTCGRAHTHTLPGLCHSAAVAAAAPRAPAEPQLLLRLTTVKVVCEFSKTRHLSCVCSPAVLERFLHFNLFFFFFLKTITSGLVVPSWRATLRLLPGWR